MFDALKAQLQKEICPYCFDPYSLKNTPFRCASPAVRCAPERDEVREKVWKESAPIARVLPATGKFLKQARCATCGQMTPKRICPHCHMDLPITTGECRNLIFAVIGAKEAGKSHYLAVLIEQIRKHVGPELDILLTPQNDHTIQRYRRDFYDPIYHEGKTIDLTVSAFADPRVRMPLVYSLTLGGKDLFGRRSIKGVVTLVFFDTAGEDLNSRDVMATVNKYIYRADGVLLLLDPLQLDQVRNQLATSTPLPARNTETETILERTTELIRLGRGLKPETRIDTPLAVAFSKFDAVESLVDPQLQLNAVPHHAGGYDLADFHAVHAEMQSLLAEWDGRTIQQHTEIHYKHAGFFGLTALGCNPHGDKKIPRVLPRRVEDPFLWLLHRHSLIPTARKSA